MWWKWESNFLWYVVWCVWSILDWAGSSGRYYIIHAIYIMHRFYVESAEPARPTSQLATSRHAEVAEIDGIVKFGVCCSLSPSLSSIAPGCASATMKFAPTFGVCAQHTRTHTHAHIWAEWVDRHTKTTQHELCGERCALVIYFLPICVLVGMLLVRV